jgi:phosphotransferase system IIB component
MWLLKLSFDQNSIVINHKLSNDFKSHIIFRKTQEWQVTFNITRANNPTNTIENVDMSEHELNRERH